MKSILFVLSIIMICPLLIGQDNPVFESEEAEAEFDVALNPVDSNNVIVATMRGFDNVDNSFLTIYYTKDFGQTWDVSTFRGKHNGEPGSGDPVISFDAEGNAFLVNLVINDFNISTIISKSTDGGATWSLFAEYNEFTDKPWLEVDRSASSPFQGNVYIPIVEEDVKLLTYGIDGTLKNRMSIPIAEQIPSVVVGNNGDVYTSNISLNDPMEIYFQHFSDEGKNQESHHIVTSFPDYTFNAYDISTRFQPAPYLAIDNSGGDYEGRIYLTFTASESSGEDFFNVYLTYTDDQGVNWSAPKPVHTDVRENVQQFYSSIFVNENGVLLLDWYDRTRFGPFSSDTDFYLGVSYDGGETIDAIKLNSKSMDFNVASVAGFGFGVGEYHQCIATKTMAMSFWSDGRKNDGDLNIYFAKVDLNNPISDVKELGLLQNKISVSNLYPQPSNGDLTLDIDLAKKYELKYDISNLGGSVVHQSKYSAYETGRHTLNIKSPDQPGVYFLSLYSTSGYMKQIKFIRQ